MSTFVVAATTVFSLRYVLLRFVVCEYFVLLVIPVTFTMNTQYSPRVREKFGLNQLTAPSVII